MSAELLLSKLDMVRQTGRGTWLACCPAHDDKSPSLSVRETDDFVVLVHCFAGCSVLEIIDAIGLKMVDLFPPRQHHGKRVCRPFPAADALRALALEALVVASCGVAVLAGRFTDVDRERLILAVQRIQSGITAAGMAYGR